MQRFGDISEVLDIFCPMHAVLGADGQVLHAGPTLQRLFPEEPLVGRLFLDLFELVRPGSSDLMHQLRKAEKGRLRLRRRSAPCTAFKGVLINLKRDGMMVVNLSFGISVMEGVRDYALTSTDFSATDLTVEMLYLIEAKSAAMEASRKLNLRLQGAMIAAEEQAFTDTLTGLKNRRALETILPRWLDSGRAVACAQMDLDYFKKVNDGLGHAAGDHVLQTVARILVEETRDEDCVARVGGDEFVIALAGVDRRDRLDGIARRIISRVEEPVIYKGEPCRISTSLGFAMSGELGSRTLEALLESADTALYAAKRAGRAQYRIFDPGMELAPDGTRAPP